MKFFDTEIHPQVREALMATQPITIGSRPDQYLRSRGILLGRDIPFPRDLREDRKGNMVAAIRDKDGVAVSYQTTVFSAQGHKRLMAKGISIPRGSAIRLFKPVNGVMGVAEGTETAISAQLIFKVATWSALSSGHIKHWLPHPNTRHLCIFTDDDKNNVGQEAAATLANEVAARGIRVSIHEPPMPIERPFDSKSRDWNDIHKEMTGKRLERTGRKMELGL